MKYYYDLHIHSVLSPCADNDMTPNNIVNMAKLCGLDFIAVSDHNCCFNLPAVVECAENAGIVAVPAMEVETSEDIHILTYFPDLKSCGKMCKTVMAALPGYKIDEKIFGGQLVMDNEDRIISKFDRLLAAASALSVYDVVTLTVELGGVAVPAHIDREAYSIISNLGSIPPDLNITAVELSRNAAAEWRTKLAGYNVLTSSDAHYLGDIFYKRTEIELEDKSVAALLEALG